MAYTESDYADAVLDMAQRGESCATESVPSAASLPERALLRAVLQEAILDVRGHATGMSQKNRRRAAQQAYYWMLSRDVTWPFSFENICALLGFDADCLRRWVLRDAPTAVPVAGSYNAISFIDATSTRPSSSRTEAPGCGAPSAAENCHVAGSYS